MTRLCDACKARPFTTTYCPGDRPHHELRLCPTCFVAAVQACEDRLARVLKRAPRRIRPISTSRPSLYPTSKLALCGGPDPRIMFAAPGPNLTPILVARPEGSTLPPTVWADVEGGLAVHPSLPLDPLDSAGWDDGGKDKHHFTVTHAASGFAIADFPSLAVALAARTALLALPGIDWTEPGPGRLRQSAGWDAARDLVAGWRFGTVPLPKARARRGGVSRHRATY